MVADGEAEWVDDGPRAAVYVWWKRKEEWAAAIMDWVSSALRLRRWGRTEGGREKKRKADGFVLAAMGRLKVPDRRALC
jgi:hypothetical protein